VRSEEHHEAGASDVYTEGRVSFNPPQGRLGDSSHDLQGLAYCRLLSPVGEAKPPP
jgi:hypothetical protein